MTSLTRQQRRFILWIARAVLLVISFQLAALDHHSRFSDVQGVEGSDAHVMHCHGNADCAEGGSAVAVVGAEVYGLPTPSVIAIYATAASQKPANVSISPDLRPPRLPAIAS